VGSSEVKNSSIKTADLAAATRTALTGQTGPKGDKGNAGAGAAGAAGTAGAAGAAGALGATGPAGPVDVISKEVLDLSVSTSFVQVTSVALPEGKWSVAVTVIVNNNGDKSAFVECSLWANGIEVSLGGETLVAPSGALDPPPISNRIGEMTLLATSLVPAGGQSIDLLCAREDGTTGTIAVVTAAVRFIATRATTITTL